MNNNFEFSYFVPTPDTTANCALSRWNDGLMNLSDFMQAYMGTRQSLEFGFSRNLNIKELLNLGLNSVVDEDGKNDYVINYRKFGDIKAYVCGFEVDIVDILNPFISWYFKYGEKTISQHNTIVFENINTGTICHFINYNSEYSQNERKSVVIDSLNALKYDVNNVMSDLDIETYFLENRQNVSTRIDTLINNINTSDQNTLNFFFGFGSKQEIENSSYNDLLVFNNFNVENSLTNINQVNLNLFKDLLYVSNYRPSYGFNKSFYLPLKTNVNSNLKEDIVFKYFNKNGVDIVFLEQRSITNSFSQRYNLTNHCYGHVMLRFLFSLKEKPSVTPFLSHDGTIVPVSKQVVSLRYSYQTNTNVGYRTYGGLGASYGVWDVDEECPVYYDGEGNPHPMSLEYNIDGMGGRDYTFWSSPVQKTENGYQFECCMPLAFYNEATGRYGNEYYATKPHEGIEVGQVMYRVPVVKRMRQNIEEAIVNTHLAKCVQDLTPADNSNAQSDNTLIFGGVVVDDFTAGLYPVAETQSIASETEYGEVKIIKTKTDGQDNGVLDLMYHYSETGELTYNDKTMPENGRAIDMITLFDTLNSLSTSENHFSDSNKIVDENDFNILKNRVVTTHAADSETQGDNQTIYGDKYFVNKIFINEEHNNSVVCGSIFGDDLNGNPIFGFDSYYHNVQIFLMDDNDENKSLILNCYNGTIGFETDDNGKIVFSTNVINHNFSDSREIIYSNINTYANILNLSINQDTTTNPGVDWRNVVFKSEWNVPNTNLNYGFGFHGNNIIADDENNNKTNMCNFVFYASSCYNSGNFAMITLTAFEDTSIELSADKIKTKGDFLPETSATKDIGSSTNKYKDAYFSNNVYANLFFGDLNGLIPYPEYNNTSSTTTINNGSIIMLWVRANAGSGAATDIHAGDVLSSTFYSFSIAKNQNGVWDTSYLISKTGQYVALNDANITSGAIILCIRVGN